LSNEGVNERSSRPIIFFSMVTVKSVDPGSVAERAGILPEDIIISVNQNKIRDVLDYRFYTTEKKLDILIHRGAKLFTVTVIKGQYDDLGIEFSSYLMDEKTSCRNKCVFCFIDQNPRGMRETVYFKDDDSRLSFLMGNYITLTNMTQEDIDRIIKMRTSPINISVHTTNPELRCRMMNNRFTGKVLSYLKDLSDAGIGINCQIVLCKGHNDKNELDRTLGDLEKYVPSVESIAVVPAGLTKHREGLYPLEPFSAQECEYVIGQVNRFGERFLEKFGKRLVYCSDEFYLKAGIELPDASYYEEYPQLDNGVGSIRSMSDEFYDELEYLSEDYDINVQKKFSIATGSAAYDFISKITDKLCDRCKGLDGRVFCIKNKFFGENITVAGLITGGDLIDQLKGKELGDYLFIPCVMLRSEGDLFLDNVSIDEVERELSIKVVVCENNGYDFIRQIMS